jgi:hypothetical protein
MMVSMAMRLAGAAVAIMSSRCAARSGFMDVDPACICRVCEWLLQGLR